MTTGRLAFSSSQVQYDLEGDRAVAVERPSGTADEGMQIRQFVSEAHSRGTRGQAWQDSLASIGIRSDVQHAGLQDFAAASMRGEADGLVLARLTVGAQTLSPLAGRPRLPIVLLARDEAINVALPSDVLTVEPGSLVILPAASQWQIALQKNVRLIALSVADTLFHGPKTGLQALTVPQYHPPGGFASIFIKAVEAAALEMDRLSAVEWSCLEDAVADLFFALLLQGERTEASARPSLAALFHRVTLRLERHLHEPELTAGRIARLEGISERYLQKLFEQNGESFGHYVRERRLQRARAALVAPGEIRLPVADVAFTCGFGDAANFSSLFKERFGMPPGAFRTHYTERASGGVASTDQRGWPVRALAGKQPQPRQPAGDVSGELVSDGTPSRPPTNHRLSVNASTIHWGYFSRALEPVIEIRSGDTVEIETLTQHASDAPDLMIRGDAAAEEVFAWTPTHKAVDRRGAGPLDASIYGRGAGEGFGVHICTGPIFIKDAEPGDVVEVRIDSMTPRLSRSPGYEGRAFGSSVAAWWGYHYTELLQAPRQRENITIYEIFADDEDAHAQALFSYRWQAQTDPFGVVHTTYDYPGVPVDRNSVEVVSPVLSGTRIPLRPHFGVIAAAPREAYMVDSVPPAYFGGNLDNWRLGKGSVVYLPVSVPGALLSIGDPHATQGDGELAGTAIECSMTGSVTVLLHKKGGRFDDLTYPLIETPTEWVLTGFSHPNYLAEFGAKSQGEVYTKSSLDLAMKDAFRKARRFLMEFQGLSEDEAIALMSAAVDFGVTQVVDGNWGVHAIIRKALFHG
jgi:acetamidase/formamidase/AraC-like DNA-binding protein